MILVGILIPHHLDFEFMLLETRNQRNRNGRRALIFLENVGGH